MPSKSKCIFYSRMGSNDYLNNYFMPNDYDTASQFTPTTYANSLLHDYSHQLMIISSTKPPLNITFFLLLLRGCCILITNSIRWGCVNSIFLFFGAGGLISVGYPIEALSQGIQWDMIVGGGSGTRPIEA